MKYNLKVACKSCPFRKDGLDAVRLRHGRIVAIHQHVTEWHGGEFPCHKTVDYDGDENEGWRRANPDEQHCAGALAYAAKLGSLTQVARMGIALLGAGDREAYGPPEAVFDSREEFLRTAIDADQYPGPDDVEACYTSGHGCLAPAGYRSSDGSVTRGTESADGACVECCDPLCSACADDHGRCEACASYDEEE